MSMLLDFGTNESIMPPLLSNGVHALTASRGDITFSKHGNQGVAY
jgi:hypothetical protein